MLATAFYSYSYTSYPVWVVGSLGVAVLLHRVFPKMPKFAASLLGFLMSAAGAYLWGRMGFDNYVANEFRLSMWLPRLSVEAWDLCHRWLMDGFLNLIPAYYAYRFLTTLGKDSLRFAIVPLFVGAFIAFQNRVYFGSFASEQILLPLVHLGVFVLFTLRGLITGKQGTTSDDPI